MKETVFIFQELFVKTFDAITFERYQTIKTKFNFFS